VESDHSAWHVVQEVTARFRPEVHAAKYTNRVILESYGAFGLESLPYNRSDLARLLVARRDHERRFSGPKRLEVLLDRSFQHCLTIGDLFDDSVMLQFFPPGLETTGLQILDRAFQRGHLLSVRLENSTYRTVADSSRMRRASPRSTDLC
jgi:hypothetical protein